ncbi:hypothetical protein LIER_08237 [Lithospermum erythrorhizon]|uniref:Uncharacterized protein n=1 Tax=Lithospermum erythrorhizon TaxID=34254 RepID=A0AAV3PBE4_LITER
MISTISNRRMPQLTSQDQSTYGPEAPYLRWEFTPTGDGRYIAGANGDYHNQYNAATPEEAPPSKGREPCGGLAAEQVQGIAPQEEASGSRGGTGAQSPRGEAQWMGSGHLTRHTRGPSCQEEMPYRASRIIRGSGMR